MFISITNAKTIQATVNTKSNEALVVEEISVIMLPERPIVTDPIFNPFALTIGELTIIFGFLLAIILLLSALYNVLPLWSLYSIKIIYNHTCFYD